MEDDEFDDLITSFSPSYWGQLYNYCPLWDAKLNALMDKYEFTSITKYTAKLGETEIWIQNHPYASFTPYNSSIRPSRITVAKARRKLIKDMVKSV